MAVPQINPLHSELTSVTLRIVVKMGRDTRCRVKVGLADSTRIVVNAPNLTLQPRNFGFRPKTAKVGSDAALGLLGLSELKIGEKSEKSPF